MMTLREQLIRFIDGLRERRVRISVAETIDAMNAVAAAGIERAAMREALAATLIKDEADRPAFDESFASFFRAPAVERGRIEEGATGERVAGGGRGENVALKPPRIKEPEQKASAQAARREAERPEHKLREEKRPGGEAAAERAEQKGENAQTAPETRRQERGEEGARAGIEAQHHARLRAAERKPFAAYSDLDYDLAREALEPLKRRFRVRMGRRMRMAGRGRVDFRRTIRASTQRGGVPVELRFRSRRPRHIDLLLLADVSGSVKYSSTLMLELMAGAKGFFRRLRCFVYVDRMAEADFEDGHLVMTPALDLYALSDFGRVLRELWERRAELLGRATVIVVMGDARNNRRPARGDLLDAIAGSCRAVIWLNPEPSERWGIGDSAIRVYQRALSALLPARNLRELERGLEGVG